MTIPAPKNQTPKKNRASKKKLVFWILNDKSSKSGKSQISKNIFFSKKWFWRKNENTFFGSDFFFRSRIFWGEYSFDVEKSDLSISDGFRAFRAQQMCFPEQSPCVGHSYAARGPVNDQNQWKRLLNLAPEPVKNQPSPVCKPEISQRQTCLDLDSAPF